MPRVRLGGSDLRIGWPCLLPVLPDVTHLLTLLSAALFEVRVLAISNLFFFSFCTIEKKKKKKASALRRVICELTVSTSTPGSDPAGCDSGGVGYGRHLPDFFESSEFTSIFFLLRFPSFQRLHFLSEDYFINRRLDSSSSD